MPWSSLRSAEIGTGSEAEMVRRFVEASRRAEIIALINAAAGEDEIGEQVTAELCEAFEAESAFVLAARAGGAPAVLVGSTGLTVALETQLLHEPICMAALGMGEPYARRGEDLLGLGARAVALAPAAQGGERVLVGVARRYDQAFDEPELGLLEAVAQATAHGLQRAWLHEERELQATRQAALARAAKALGQSLDPERVLDTLCREVSLATGGEIVNVYFCDQDGLEVVASYGAPIEMIGLRRPRGEGLSGRVVITGVPQVSNDYRGENLAPESTSALAEVRSAMSAPLRRRGGVDGAISVGFLDGRFVTTDEVQLLSAFADLAGVACRNADDHEAARLAASHDALTGALNHAAFQGRLREEVARADRGADPFSVVMLDLEDFKAVNERHGHLAGDTVLRTVGEILRDGVRSQDQVARFGGDEFAVILPETPEHAAAVLVDRLREAMKRCVAPDGEPVRLHAGLAEWRPGEPPTSVVERADSALRAVKRSRRVHAPAGAQTAAPPAAANVDASAAAVHERRATKRRRRLAVAARIGAKLSRLLDAQSIADATVAELTGMLEYEFAALLRLTGDGVLTTVGASDHGAAAPAEWAWTRSDQQGAAGRALRERRAVLVIDAPPADDPDGPRTRSELAVPVHAGSELWGVIDVRALRPGAFDEDDARLVELVADHAGAALRTAELYRKLEQTHLGVAEALAAALEAKDGYTAGHARWIADLAVEVGRELDLPAAYLDDLRYGAIFHDIGKIAVPDAILNKAGPLTAEEFEVIKRHPVVGEQILAPVPFLADVRRIVRHDHERWDGTGYPDGLRGPQIPIGARIVLVVDAYHAMISDRPYRRAMPEAAAREELKANAGTQFDPDVVEALLALLDRRDPPS